MSEKKNIEFKENGLVCDNTECDWANPTIKDSELEEWIDVACPDCGDNVLTMEDYHNYKILMIMVDGINDIDPNTLTQMTKKIDIKTLKDHPMFKDVKGVELLDTDKRTTMTINTHGKLKIDEIKITDEEE